MRGIRISTYVIAIAALFLLLSAATWFPVAAVAGGQPEPNSAVDLIVGIPMLLLVGILIYRVITSLLGSFPSE